MALPASLSLIVNDVTLHKTHDSQLSALIVTATLATMLGKIVLGPSTDKLGGERTMKITMLAITMALLSCSVCGSVQSFGISWIILSFVYAAAWGAVGKVVRERFPVAQWSTQLVSE